MLHKRNLLEYTTIVSCIGTLISVLLNYITNISPITGIWFPLYILTVFIVSLCVSFKFIQWLLKLNKPIEYDIEGIIKDYPYLSFLSQLLPQTRRPKLPECREYDTNELSVISTVLEKRLVSSWYVPYISQEIGFPFACKQMLDQIIGKSFQISNKIESKDVFVDICTILTSHLKEYQKAIKRHEKSPTNSIESLYKKSHPTFDVTSTKPIQTADHCTSILRIIFKELVPWELWDTPHSELLVRILSKKLDNFIDSTLAEPAWLNNKLLSILEGKSVSNQAEEKSKPLTTTEETVSNIKQEPTSIESVSPPVMTKGTIPVDQRVIDEVLHKEPVINTIQNIIEEVPVTVTSTEPMDTKHSPVLRQKRGRQGRNEVKIYDRIIEGSVRTWDTAVDLQCISLGQDLLASLDGEITLSRLWGQDADPDGSPNPPRRKSPQPLWFGEEETIEVDPIETSPHKEFKKEHSPKPTELLKDLQSTVSQAKTKIGDLQVEDKIFDVSRKQISSDEAAGMMEGLLDFGIAGLKKGLRFTGLSDDSQEKFPSHHRSDRSPPEASRGKPVPEYKDIHAPNAHRDDNPTVPPLLKQQRVISQDSVPSQSKSLVHSEPVLVPLADSPEPEYEEAADLSTSIAKLRCLLEQRADSSPRGEEVWWESAEETRGRTQQHHSSRPVDSATLADEYDMTMDRNSSPGQTTINMQRLDKLFQRTVTGVFNSLRTAVGADEAPARAQHDWRYVCAGADLSVSGAVARLVGTRRAFTHVEAALDSLQQLAPPATCARAAPEDFEEWCARCGVRWCALCAACAGAGLLTSHVAHRLATLLLADLAESLLESWLADFAAWLRNQVFVIFEQLSERDDASFTTTAVNRPFDLDKTCQIVLENTPALLKVFGEETVSSATRLLVSSFTHKEINKDITFRVLDLLAGHFKVAAELRNPSFDNN